MLEQEKRPQTERVLFRAKVVRIGHKEKRSKSRFGTGGKAQGSSKGGKCGEAHGSCHSSAGRGWSHEGSEAELCRNANVEGGVSSGRVECGRDRSPFDAEGVTDGERPGSKIRTKKKTWSKNTMEAALSPGSRVRDVGGAEPDGVEGGKTLEWGSSLSWSRFCRAGRGSGSAAPVELGYPRRRA